MPIIYDVINQNTLPIQVESADIVFLAGNPASPDYPRIEHVAFVFDRTTLRTDEDFESLQVLGFPELQSSTNSLRTVTVSQSYGPYYQSTEDKPVRRLGDPKRGWNIIGRSNLNPSQGKTLVLRLATDLGINRHKFHYNPNSFTPKPSLEAPSHLETNCLGFVCHALHKMGPKLLTDPMTVYETGRKDETRNFPSVGHLVVALDTPAADLPYNPNPAEARAKAFAKHLFLGRDI